MNDCRILDACILLASVILSAAIICHAFLAVPRAGPEVGRYQFQPSNPPGIIWVVDTDDGNINQKQSLPLHADAAIGATGWRPGGRRRNKTAPAPRR